MKLILLALAILLAFGILIAQACPTGYIEAHPGVCSEDIKPESVATQAPTTDPKIMSAEKPPHNQQPEWQTGEVHADMGKPGVEPDTSTAHDYESERNER